MPKLFLKFVKFWPVERPFQPRLFGDGAMKLIMKLWKPLWPCIKQMTPNWSISHVLQVLECRSNIPRSNPQRIVMSEGGDGGMGDINEMKLNRHREVCTSSIHFIMIPIKMEFQRVAGFQVHGFLTLPGWFPSHSILRPMLRCLQHVHRYWLIWVQGSAVGRSMLWP